MPVISKNCRNYYKLLASLRNMSLYLVKYYKVLTSMCISPIAPVKSKASHKSNY